MFTREIPDTTLADVLADLTEPVKSLRTSPDQMRVDLTSSEDRLFFVGQTEIPMSSEGLAVLGNWFQVPNKFLIDRCDPEQQQWILMSMLERAAGQYVVSYSTANGLKGIREANKPEVITPEAIARRVANVMGEEAQVIEMISNTDLFLLDVVVPDSHDWASGGDQKVGDVSRGGIRVTRDQKHNLAPTVQPYLFRLVCTNGMEVPDNGIKVDARGLSPEEVLDEFEVLADHAFRRVEMIIKSLYALRDEKLSHPERTMIRLTEEQRLPARLGITLAKRIPTVVAEDGSATLFDLVNLITNGAVDPHVKHKHGVRRTLEAAAGRIVMDHAERCSYCQSKLTNGA